jgi:lipopolysaccharide transport system permease protein
MDIEIHIRPHAELGRDTVEEMWRYHDLFSMLVWRDLAVRYKQTVLGPIWFLIQPLLPTLVFTVVFGRIARMSTEGAPGFLFFLTNQIAWNYFATNFTSASGCLHANLNLFTKVYFPRLIVPVASIASNSAAVVIQLGFFFVAWWSYRAGGIGGAHLVLTPLILWTPLVLLLVAAQGLGFGLWMAALTAKYRDLQHLVPVITQLWMYGSCVVFPLSQVPPQYQRILSLNPVTFVSEAFRRCLLGVGTVTWPLGLYSVGVTFAVLASGIYIYHGAARSFVDVA